MLEVVVSFAVLTDAQVQTCRLLIVELLSIEPSTAKKEQQRRTLSVQL